MLFFCSGEHLMRITVYTFTIVSKFSGLTSVLVSVLMALRKHFFHRRSHIGTRGAPGFIVRYHFIAIITLDEELSWFGPCYVVMYIKTQRGDDLVICSYSCNYRLTRFKIYKEAHPVN